MNIVLLTIGIMTALGLIAALILYIVAKKFHVAEDPRIAEVEELLPGANCGGCGQSGCHAFAVACCGADTLEGLNCPGAGAEVMATIADIVGLAPVKTEPKVAIVRCNGACSLRPQTSDYDGVRSCAIEAATFSGTTDCAYGCLGCGDCVETCPYDAIHIDSVSGLPVVDFNKCVGCGRCVAACPRSIITLAPANTAGSRVWVACMNHDKGGIAAKECEVSCIGCGKCLKVCSVKAPKIKNFLAEIDPQVCTGCLECVDACPHCTILFAEKNSSHISKK